MKAETFPAATNSATDLSLGKVVALLAAQTIVFVALGLVLWHFSGRELAVFLVPTATGAAQGLALGAAFILTAWLVFALLPEIADRLVRLQADTYRFLGPNLPMWAIVAISLGAGIGEEALFRAGLQVLLGDHVGITAAIALSSAAFAVFHLGKPLITALLFVIGALFGVVYWLTDSLLAVMIGHVLYDIWALRYLHKSFLRLGLFDEPAPSPRPLANPADAS
jgi:membrane protease YdiL (CAAX protease family)